MLISFSFITFSLITITRSVFCAVNRKRLLHVCNCTSFLQSLPTQHKLSKGQRHHQLEATNGAAVSHTFEIAQCNSLSERKRPNHSDEKVQSLF